MKKYEPISVADLIAYLQTQPQDLLVAYKCCSEQITLAVAEISIVDLCEPRPDGWIQNARPDMPTRRYLLLPGN